MKKLSFLAMATVLTLTACGKDTPLIGRTAPDETTVVAGPALTVPPDFTLRPPRTGTDAREDMLRRAPSVAPIDTDGMTDGWLLQKAQQQSNVQNTENIREDLTPPAPAETTAAETKSDWWNVWGNDKPTDQTETPAE